MDQDRLKEATKGLTLLPALTDLPEDFNPEEQGAFSVMDPGFGDYKIIWNKSNPDEVAQARETFNNLKKKGFAAFSVKGKDGEKDRKITEFDPNAERLIMVPPIQGG